MHKLMLDIEYRITLDPKEMAVVYGEGRKKEEFKERANNSLFADLMKVKGIMDVWYIDNVVYIRGSCEHDKELSWKRIKDLIKKHIK